ncbi:SDR family oxidoreductase [Nesterenkonia flava]|uniref:SDR family NAD(P)-dependent oxidoreductase n=1 Tax=Nesterenkonia flava TaxID=469799 RepID=A0ABU1FPI2_9MICC|nr:SDR family NAD(P)-dependent oxidoreductase [Nesterenkonia flava]MDR5710543.1 SDR family NAD(P)-dependent oxidoreductase [Nesterenkonia flava]
MKTQAPLRDVQNKVAVITGGSSGIGRGIALAFARAGMTVVVTGRRQNHLDETQEVFASHGLQAEGRSVDVTDLQGMRELADYVADRYGRVDVLVNNAGIGLTGPVEKATPDDWNWVIDVNIRGVGHGIQAFLPKIQAHGEGGWIINTSSMGGLMPIVAGLYSMTKAAVIALSEALHIELREQNIGVSAYMPGPVHSNIALGTANRPAQYGESGYQPPSEEFAALAKKQPYMSAEEAGERVLQGLQRGDMFILTHPEFKEGVAIRHRAIEHAFPDEPLNQERAAAIPFLTDATVYTQEQERPSPTPPVGH